LRGVARNVWNVSTDGVPRSCHSGGSATVGAMAKRLPIA